MKAIYSQFRKPTGPLGWLVGLAMSLKNADRSRWVLGLLAAKPGEHVFEVGFGSGADIVRLLEAVAPDGTVTGIDASDVMVRLASRRNRRSVIDGRVVLEQATLIDLPIGEARFDAAYSVNCAQFWPDLEAAFVTLRQVVRTGGRAVVAVQPKHSGASRADSEQWLHKLASTAERASWTVAARALGPQPVPTAAVVLRRQGS